MPRAGVMVGVGGYTCGDGCGLRQALCGHPCVGVVVGGAGGVGTRRGLVLVDRKLSAKGHFRL